MNSLHPSRSAQYITPLLEYCRGQFPKSCQTCGHIFKSFRDYVNSTEPIGAIVADNRGTILDDAIGTISLANCRCGTTVSLECGEAGSGRYKSFIEAISDDAQDLGVPVERIMEILRSLIRYQARAEA